MSGGAPGHADHTERRTGFCRIATGWDARACDNEDIIKRDHRQERGSIQMPNTRRSYHQKINKKFPKKQRRKRKKQKYNNKKKKEKKER